MILKAPGLEEKSLYEVLKLVSQEDTDICDDIWDWCSNLGYGGYDSFEEIDNHYGKDNPDGGYYKFILLCCLNIKVKKYQPKWYTVCYVSKFIDENRAAFDKFMNERNREGYRPKDFKGKIDIDDDEELFYEVYMQTFENLIIGNYCDSDYLELFNYLIQ